MKTTARLLSIAVITLLVSACFSPLSYKGDQGDLNIVLGGSGRAALSPAKENLRCDVTFHGPGSQTISRAASWGETVSVQAAPGVWRVTVKAFDPAGPGTIKAIGEETVDVKAGVSNTVAVKMAVYTEVTNWSQLGGAVSAGTYDDFIVIKSGFSGNADSTISLTINKKVTVVAESDKTIKGNGLSSFGSFFSISSGHLVFGGSSSYGGTLTLDGSGFSGTFGAPVAVNSGGSFTMHSGVITENSRVGGNGGGVNIDGGTFTMTGGRIYKNNAGTLPTNSGGGVYITGGGTFTMSGGTISENKASIGNGGGVCIDNGTFNLNSPASKDSISGNSVMPLLGEGPQVYKGPSGTFKVNGAAQSSY